MVVGAAARSRASRPRTREACRLLAGALLAHAAASLVTANVLFAQPLTRPAWPAPEFAAVSGAPAIPDPATPFGAVGRNSGAMVSSGPLARLHLRVVLPDPTSDRWFGRDKWLHAAVAASLQFTAYAFLSTQGASRATSHLGATLLTGAASVGKEWHDARSGGVFSRRDLVWDAVGALAGSTAAHQVDGA